MMEIVYIYVRSFTILIAIQHISWTLIINLKQNNYIIENVNKK